MGRIGARSRRSIFIVLTIALVFLFSTYNLIEDTEGPKYSFYTEKALNGIALYIPHTVDELSRYSPHKVYSFKSTINKLMSMLVNSSNGSTAQNASHLDDHPEIEKPRDYFPISIPHRDSGDEVSKFGRMREHMKSYTPVHPNENRGIDYYSKDKPSRQAVYSSPECKTLQLKPKYIESEVASKLMKMCPVFKNQFKYHKGERLYLPEYTIKLMGEGNTKRNRLMIVCHPDDEIIFGGDELLRYPGEWVIVYITNDHKRIKGVKKVMHAINANEPPVSALVHRIVFHLLAKAGVSKMSGTQITTMKLNRSQPRSANKSFIEQRQQLCKTMYYRSSRKWMRMIEKATTVSFDPTKEQIDYDIDHLLCQ